MNENDGGMEAFHKELSSLLNRYSWDNKTNTPDYILARFLTGAMLNYAATMSHAMSWHGWKSLGERLCGDRVLKADE